MDRMVRRDPETNGIKCGGSEIDVGVGVSIKA
jgi:hypothetical protein